MPNYHQIEETALEKFAEQVENLRKEVANKKQ